MKFGKIHDEPIAEYHGADAVSKTRLDTFRRNPELYRRIFVAKTAQKPAPTEAMIFGNACGCWALEGVQAYTQRYIVLPEDAPKRPTKAQINAKNPSTDSLKAMEWWGDFNRRAEGKTILTPEDQQQVLRCHDALQRDARWVELTKGGRPEVTFRIQGEHFPVQCRPDWWNDDGCALSGGYPYIVDLKTIAKLPKDDPDHLPWHIAECGYHRSAWMYPEVVATALGWPLDLPRPRFFLFFVEKEEPYATEMVEFTETDIEVGEREVTDALIRLQRAIQTGVWVEPQTKPRVVSLPPRYVRQSLEQTEPHVAA